MHDDWYLRIGDEIKAVMDEARAEKDEQRAAAIKDAVRNYFIDRIKQGRLPLATEGPNFDVDRRPIDTVVIHHTSNNQPYSLEKLNVVHMLNLYVPWFTNPNDNYPQVKGQALWSNHVRDGQPVFWAYHWLVRRDGEAVRLLEDQEIGWHAGDWEVNARSVAICLDNDYENGEPSTAELAAVAKIIHQHYPQIKPDQVIGHCEVNPQSTSPGKTFLSSWKAKLLEQLA
jgi:hypothetical protein